MTDFTEADYLNLKRSAFVLKQKSVDYASIIAEIEGNTATKILLESKITELRAQNIYVLRYGDLEHYLSLHNKGLQNVVDYCANHKINSMSETLKQDLTEIFVDLLNR